MKNNNERNLIKYSVSLLVVAIVFIAIGGISLSRSINRGDDRIIRNFNINDKVKEISEENLNLTQRNSALEKELEQEKTEKSAVLEENKAIEEENKAYELYIQALEDEEKHDELIDQIKGLEISEQLKTKLTGEE